ncbi:unnamed protein product [Kluyveromyces dobzhanskii CBS 2104]|uniref:WGS project CCBQ000000000 data, contig 00049 n=1 Tax=Kluyveromyces dobzhanskii CBS 2104 TaxID=1427455 RepID=A0A0A8L587_9SACH|nr:unnamed protein product [Kluyveromyces dobzhanskii CBS 2104]
MSDLIPEKVNITHALQSTVIEKMKSDIKEYQSLPELQQEQMEVVDNYIDSLDSAFSQFCMDNDHVEKRKGGVTNADVELFEGLKRMYLTYMSQLSEIKKERIQQDQEISRDNPLEYMKQELPYLQPSDRNLYVKELVKNPQLLLKQNDELLKTVQNLAIIDGSLKDNLRLYSQLLLKVGYNDGDINSILPHESNDGSAIIPPEQNFIQENIVQDSDSDEKKKIPFSKYLKKDVKEGNEPVEINGNGKRSITVGSVGEPISKKVKSDTAGNNGLISILKTDNKKKTKTATNIRFEEDSKLVTVFGDGIPNSGLIASPKQLKKILKPFKDGEPAEIILKAWNGRGAQTLFLEIKGVSSSDISELRNGPVKLSTHVHSSLAKNFSAFSPDLNKPALEPVHIEDEDDAGIGKRKQRAPIVARAFGKNSLLLRKDRGGLPYKRVPDVQSNTYPIRPDTSESDDTYEVPN